MSFFGPETDLSKYEPDSLLGGRPRLKEEYRNKKFKTEVVKKPTRDLNDDRDKQQKPKYGRWQDAELPDDRVWSGGSRDFDERSGTYRPGHRSDDYKFIQTDKGRNRERQRPEPKRNWWQEPRKEYRPEKSAQEKRMELLTGGTGTGGSSYSDRQSLLTGRGLSSNEDRQAMLTGRSDPPKEKWQSQYGGRREYDPQDREFNRQFNTEPTNNRDVRSWFPDSEPSKPVRSNDWLDFYEKQLTPEMKERRRQKQERGLKSGSFVPAKNEGSPSERYDDSSVRERLRALEGRPQTEGWQEDRIKALENRPQSTGGNWDESRIKALESRSPIVNQPTVDLSGVEGRLSQLEGKGSDWQENRIAALEGRKPQDLSGIQGRLTSLENYYKNDPPPAESTGNRYEDKMASLIKGWDMTDKATKWDYDDERLKGYRNVRDKSGQGWANTLEEGYVQGVRDLNREYNKPVHTANIKGREYKAYDPKAAARLRYLDTQNIHEDTYLGQGTWQNQYGEDVKGWDRGYQDRYFTSHSGLDKDSDEYKRRFGSHFSGDVGKDYAWYQ
tara:strand:+ start:5723 stop:7387 length:1665 start_codon:yes stop_codon:yes gene_type:complete